jgi:hypothetical protein
MLHLACGLFLTTNYRSLSRFESHAGVSSVTERLGSGGTATAERERSLADGICHSVPIDKRHRVAVDQVRAVLQYFNGRQGLLQ